VLCVQPPTKELHHAHQHQQQGELYAEIIRQLYAATNKGELHTHTIHTGNYIMNSSPRQDHVSDMNIDLNQLGEQRLVCPKCETRQSSPQKDISFNSAKRVGVCFKCGWTFSLDYLDKEQSLKISQAKPIDYSRRKKRLDDLLSGSVKITDPKAAHGVEYLYNRLEVDEIQFPHNLLFHANLPIYRELELINYYDAIVCPVQSLHGDIIGAHRIFISQGKKAPIDSPKMMMPKISEAGYKGGVVRLFSDQIKITPENEGISIGICEGIETGLYINQVLGITMWCTGSASNMVSLDYPKDIDNIYIFGDNDIIRSHERRDKMTGQKAARILAARMRDDEIKATVRIPKQPGDWLDQWINQRGAEQ